MSIRGDSQFNLKRQSVESELQNNSSPAAKEKLLIQQQQQVFVEKEIVDGIASSYNSFELLDEDEGDVDQMQNMMQSSSNELSKNISRSNNIMITNYSSGGGQPDVNKF